MIYRSKVYNNPNVISMVMVPSIFRYCDSFIGFLFSRLSLSITQFSRQKVLIGLLFIIIFGGSLQANISKLSTGRLKLPYVWLKGVSTFLAPTDFKILVSSCAL